MKIYQRLYGNSFETLYVFPQKNGWRISCECQHGLNRKGITYADRDWNLNGIPKNSKCRHSVDLREALLKGDLSKFKDVSPKKLNCA